MPLCHTTHQKGTGFRTLSLEEGSHRRAEDRIWWTLQDIRLLDSKTAPCLLITIVCILYVCVSVCVGGGEGC